MTLPIDQILFDSLPSTNRWAKEHAHLLEPHHVTCVRARQQTAGKGQHNRHWASPPGENLYISLFFLQPVSFPYLHNLGQLFCLSCSQVLRQEGLQPQIKWPNDILLNGKKCGGVLVETFPIHAQMGIVLGFGINVNTPSEILQTIDQPATSLEEISNRKWNADDLLSSLLEYFFSELPVLQSQGFVPFLNLYEALLCGKEGTFTGGGRYERIDEQGRLHVRLASGEIRVIV